MTEAALVCGIDVGSQGSCLAVFDAGGERLATSYQPHTLSYPRPGWAEQDPRDWRAAVRQRLPRPLCPRQPPPGAGGVVRLAARRARVRRPKRAARRAGDHLDGPAGRPAVPRRRGADRRPRSGTPGRAATSTARTWRPRSPGSRASGPTRTRAPTATSSPGAYMVRVACDADAVDRSNASSTMALDPDAGSWDDRLLEAFGIDPARLPPVVGADEPVGEITAGFAADTGLPPATTVVCGCGDEMAATLGAGLVEPGVGLRRPRARPSRCARWPTAAIATGPGSPNATLTPRRAAGCSRTRDGRPGASYRWFRDQLGGGLDYEGLNALAAEAPGGVRRARLPAVDGRRDGSPVGGGRARRLVRAHAGARPGAHGAGAARGLGLRASRCGRGDRGRRPRAVAHRVRRGRRPLAARAPDAGRHDRGSRHVVGGRRDDGPRRGDAGGGGSGLHPSTSAAARERCRGSSPDARARPGRRRGVRRGPPPLPSDLRRPGATGSGSWHEGRPPDGVTAGRRCCSRRRCPTPSRARDRSRSTSCGRRSTTATCGSARAGPGRCRRSWDPTARASSRRSGRASRASRPATRSSSTRRSTGARARTSPGPDFRILGRPDQGTYAERIVVAAHQVGRGRPAGRGTSAPPSRWPGSRPGGRCGWPAPGRDGGSS